VLVDYNSRRILAAKNPDKRIEPASLTKMMTTYIIDNELHAGRIRPTDLVRVSEKAWHAEGSRMFAQVGYQIPVQDLVRGIIIQSGNDASIAMAEHIAGTEIAFSEIMNDHARRLGMKNTHFVNATGLSHPDHYTTAHDLSILARALIRDFPNSYKIYSEKWFTFHGIKQPNRNRLLWREDFVDGIKTGHTETAGYCLAASGQQKGMRLISVVLGTDSDNARTDYSQQLLRYGFRFYETHKLFNASKPLKEAKVWMGKKNSVALGLTEDLYVTIPQGQYKKLNATMTFNRHFQAPLQKGKPYGTLDVMLDNEKVMQQPLVAMQPVEKAALWRCGPDYLNLTVRKLLDSATS
jgi:D-alanyl-D-alanine carboxypeptidase (penicillin-binding protein 5/6)